MHLALCVLDSSDDGRAILDGSAIRIDAQVDALALCLEPVELIHKVEIFYAGIFPFAIVVGVFLSDETIQEDSGLIAQWRFGGHDIVELFGLHGQKTGMK